jgi:cytochrome c biogenesis protein CcdA
MKLQLSGRMKQRVHEAIRTRSSQRLVLVSSFSLGAVISFFELACTGQMYLPAIVYVTRLSFWKGAGLLLLYNLLFILPLAVIFILFASGLSSKRLADFFQKKLAIIKLLTTLMFITLGLFLLFFAL